jgi:hypothetical protein
MVRTGGRTLIEGARDDELGSAVLALSVGLAACFYNHLVCTKALRRSLPWPRK